jgi:TRAP-type transport system small permease protein
MGTGPGTGPGGPPVASARDRPDGAPMRFLLRRLLAFPLEEVLGTLLLAIVFVVMLSAVGLRSTLNLSFIWTEEFARYGLVAITFLGIGVGFRNGSHVFINLHASLSPMTTRVLRAVSVLATIAFLVILLYYAASLSLMIRSRSPAMQFPNAWLFAFVAVAAALGLVRVLANLLHRDDEGP